MNYNGLDDKDTFTSARTLSELYLGLEYCLQQAEALKGNIDIPSHVREKLVQSYLNRVEDYRCAIAGYNGPSDWVR